MGYPRSSLVPPDTTGVYHCVSRCVRRAWLCGEDPLTGRSFEHRRAWVEERLIEICGYFAVSLLAYAVMSNHVHVVLRVDAEVVDSWSDEEVAERWARLFGRADETPEQRALRIAAMIEDAQRMATLRSRLRSLAWFMRCLAEPIARRANGEDEVTGRFWEGRYKCQALLDDAAVAAAMCYVDLNPIRAGIAEELADSEHTSIATRLERAKRDRGDLTCPLAPVAGIGRFVMSMCAADYIDLVDWTGRQVRPDKKGAITPGVPTALSRLQVQPAAWESHVQAIRGGYWRAIGRVDQLLAKAVSMGQRWLKGKATAGESIG